MAVGSAPCGQTGLAGHRSSEVRGVCHATDTGRTTAWSDRCFSWSRCVSWGFWAGTRATPAARASPSQDRRRRARRSSRGVACGDPMILSTSDGVTAIMRRPGTGAPHRGSGWVDNSADPTERASPSKTGRPHPASSRSRTVVIVCPLLSWRGAQQATTSQVAG
jgi:hypothetical protein